MNPEIQRLEIAKLCDIENGFVPDYLNDRDPIIEAIWDKIVGNAELEKAFLKQLEAIWGNREDDETICVHKMEMALICSSSAYLCEALLRTIGKWKEVA